MGTCVTLVLMALFRTTALAFSEAIVLAAGVFDLLAVAVKAYWRNSKFMQEQQRGLVDVRLLGVSYT